MLLNWLLTLLDYSIIFHDVVISSKWFQCNFHQICLNLSCHFRFDLLRSYVISWTSIFPVDEITHLKCKLQTWTALNHNTHTQTQSSSFKVATKENPHTILHSNPHPILSITKQPIKKKWQTLGAQTQFIAFHKNIIKPHLFAVC